MTVRPSFACSDDERRDHRPALSSSSGRTRLSVDNCAGGKGLGMAVLNSFSMDKSSVSPREHVSCARRDNTK